MLVVGGSLNDVLHEVVRKYIWPGTAHESPRYALPLTELRFPSDDSLIGIVNVEGDLHVGQGRTAAPSS